MAVFCTQYSPYSFNFSISASYPGAPEPSPQQKMKKTKTKKPPQNNETSELLSDVNNSQAPSSKECLSFSKEPHSRTGSRARVSY